MKQERKTPEPAVIQTREKKGPGKRNLKQEDRWPHEL
jgi:hypothetical protein